MQEAWIDRDVAQCGYCQPGQIMAAVAVVNKAKAEGREVTDADLEQIRNICRCGTYTRIREAVQRRRRARCSSRPLRVVSRGSEPHVKVSTTAATRGSAATATVTRAGPRAVCMSPPVRIACSLSRNRR